MSRLCRYLPRVSVRSSQSTSSRTALRALYTGETSQSCTAEMFCLSSSNVRSVCSEATTVIPCIRMLCCTLARTVMLQCSRVTLACAACPEHDAQFRSRLNSSRRWQGVSVSTEDVYFESVAVAPLTAVSSCDEYEQIFVFTN